MSDYTRWRRVNRERTGEPSLATSDHGRCALAERETNSDLRKPIQQLICDVHGETLDRTRPIEENLLRLSKPMVPLMGRVALEHERTSALLLRLTWILVVLTVCIVGLTIVMLWRMR